MKGVGRGGAIGKTRGSESDNRSPLVSGSNPVAAAFAFICKFEKVSLSPITKIITKRGVDEMITLALIRFEPETRGDLLSLSDPHVLPIAPPRPTFTERTY